LGRTSGQGFGLLIGLDEPISREAALPEISATDSFPNLVVDTRSGEQVRLSELQGSNGVVFIVFSTNCGMAFAEAMVWQRLNDRLENMPLVGLTTDAEWDAVDELKQRARLTFPLATLTPSQARAAGIVGYPTIVAVERS
jgi:peroxiredoxin